MAYVQTSYTEISLLESELILHGVGLISPTEVNFICSKGMTDDFRTRFGFSRMSQIWYDPLDVAHPYTMYAVNVVYNTTSVSIRHYSGHTSSGSTYNFGLYNGNRKLYKYYSTDGATWIQADDSPQSVWCQLNEPYGSGEIVEAAPSMIVDNILPVPYCRGVFDVKKKAWYLIEGFVTHL